jgi:hypothetical protein
VRLTTRASVYLDPLVAASERAGNLTPYLEVGGALRVRFGAASVDEQFETQTEMSRSGGRVIWPRTKDFGRRPAPRRTLQDRGALREAWLGIGPGAVVDAGPTHVDVGVDAGVLPYAAVFQRDAPTVQKVTPKQRIFLGMGFGVWLKAGARITNQPRRVGANPTMARRVGEGAAFYIVHGDNTGGAEQQRSAA